MGKRAKLSAKYLELADEAVKVADIALKQIDATLRSLDAKEDNHTIQQLNQDKEKLTNKIQAVNESRGELEMASESRDRYKANKDKLKDNFWQVTKSTIKNPIASIKGFNEVSKEGSRTAKMMDDAVDQLEKNIGELSGATKITNLVLEDTLQQSPLVNAQKMQTEATENSSNDFTKDDINAFDKAASSRGGKYDDFQPSEPLNDTYQVGVSNSAPNQELKQDQSSQEGITAGNDDESNTSSFRM